MPNSREPNRFSSMAHLFLSDIREGKTESEETSQEQVNPPAARVRRISPSGRSVDGPSPVRQDLEETSRREQELPVVPPMAPTPEPTLETPISEEELQETEDRMHVIGVYCSHLHWEGNKALSEFARFLAGQGKLVGVLKLEAWSAHLRIYYRKTDQPKMPAMDTRSLEPEEYGEDSVRESETTVDAGSTVGIWDQLESMREKLNYVLISWGPEFGRFEEQIHQLIDGVCVIATPERKHLVSSYQFLKSLSGRNITKPLGLFIADVDSFGEAQGTFAKLAKTVRDFAGLTVENYGYSLSDGAVVQEFLSRTELRDQSETWFDGLANWFKGHHADDKTEERVKPAMIKETSDKTQEPVRPAAPARSLTQTRSDGTEIFMVGADLGVGRLAETIGETIVPDGAVISDSLIGFLRGLGLDCARFTRQDGTGVLVWVVMAGQDATVPIWAAEHYPERQDQLILVTDQPFGQIEKMLWVKHFDHVDVRRAIRGQFQGKDVVIIGQ